MNGTTLVWITTRSLAFVGPDGLHPIRFHRMSAKHWWRTFCGVDGGVDAQHLVAVRYDTATVFAVPCRRCWPEETP